MHGLTYNACKLCWHSCYQQRQRTQQRVEKELAQTKLAAQP